MAETNSAENIIFVAGASGYIGGRLVPRLLEQGYKVRTLSRAPQRFQGRPWAQHPNFRAFKGDMLDRTALTDSMHGCHVAYFLVNSIDNPDYAQRIAAQNMAIAAKEAGLQRIISLGLLTPEQHDPDRSAEHTDPGRILLQGEVPATILRASMIIGSGSASFEVLRYLVDRLPLIIAPLKSATPCQPIGIRNVILYLIGCLEHPETVGQCFDIGLPETTNYCELMQIYAAEAGLKRRSIQLPWLNNARLSSYWIHLVTPISMAKSRPLAKMLSHPVVCHDHRITNIIPQELLDARTCIRLAIQRTREYQVETSWSDSGELPPMEWSTCGDPHWAGGSMFEDARHVVLKASPEQIWPSITSLGGNVGYYYANWLWKVRGFMDQMVGGFGLRRGRRSSKILRPGDAIDFWRVVRVDPLHSMVLRAEMKLPGEALLSFELRPVDAERTEIRQIARFLPQGMLGPAYWYAVLPFHHFVFNGMLRGIAMATHAPVLQGPEHFDLQDG